MQDWLLWDGQCGFCRACADWVARHDHLGRIRSIPYQDMPSPPMNDALREKCRAAVQVVTADGEQFAGGAACAHVLEQIGYRRLGRFMRTRPMRSLVEWGYRRVANNRALLSRILGIK